MKKTALILSCAITLGVGAIVALGNGLIASQAMAASLGTDTAAVVTDTRALSSGIGGNTDTVAISPNIKVKEYNVTDEPGTFGKEVATVVMMQTDDGVGIMTGYDDGGKFVDKKAFSGEKLSDIAVPGEQDIAKEKAIELAKKEIIQKYALDQDTSNKFNSHADFEEVINLKSGTKTTQWHVIFEPKDPDADFHKIGAYEVILDSRTGKFISAEKTPSNIG
jgi:ABC-type branched-subunit amino acid transport system substrate-binding protein